MCLHGGNELRNQPRVERRKDEVHCRLGDRVICSAWVSCSAMPSLRAMRVLQAMCATATTCADRANLASGPHATVLPSPARVASGLRDIEPRSGE
jgi:hypothetical protein